MCQCDHVEPGKKQAAYFSISEVVSEIEKNMVVTGVRFESKYGIIHASVTLTTETIIAAIIFNLLFILLDRNREDPRKRENR